MTLAHNSVKKEAICDLEKTLPEMELSETSGNDNQRN